MRSGYEIGGEVDSGVRPATGLGAVAEGAAGSDGPLGVVGAACGARNSTVGATVESARCSVSGVTVSVVLALVSGLTTMTRAVAASLVRTA